MNLHKPGDIIFHKDNPGRVYVVLKDDFLYQRLLVLCLKHEVEQIVNKKRTLFFHQDYINLKDIVL